MAAAVETVLRDEALALRWLPGRRDRMVVVFTGMKRGLGGADFDEFAASASQGGANSVLFVTDRRSTWFSAPGLWRRTVTMIRYVRMTERVREVVSLGTSMGGYAALLLPRDLAVARAIGFAPQVTMDRGVLLDDRWPDVAADHGGLPVRSVADTVAGTRTQYFVVASRDCAADVAHLDLMPRDPERVVRIELPGARHNPAGVLKRAGLLGHVVAAMVAGRRYRAERLCRRLEARAA